MASEYSLENLGDDTLITRLKALVDKDHRVTSVMLAHIAEVDARRLYLPAACASMHAYCVEVLGFDDGQAYKRIHAARAARMYPSIFERVANGSLHLTGVTLLAPHLTPENHEGLLQSASHKTKRQIEEMIAVLAPKPDVPPAIRRLPSPAAQPRVGEREPSPPRDLFGPSPTAAMPVSDPVGRASVAVPSPVAPAREPKRLTEIVAPLSAERYKVQFTASKDLRDKIEQAKALLRHQIPDGDLAKVIDCAIDELIEKLMRRKFAKTASAKKPRERSAPSEGGARRAGTEAPAGVSPEPPANEARDRPSARSSAEDQGGIRRSRHIPNAVKRQVAIRDDLQCTFVDQDGRRCSERGFIELDHAEPFGKGGAHSVSNVALKCRAHNAYLAELEYGAAFMAEKRRRGSRDQEALPPAAVPT